MRVILTIAGSDSCSGAGIQADLKTISALGGYGMTAITAITAQNLAGVTGIQPVDPDILCKQIAAVFDGFPVAAVKTGMIFNEGCIRAVAGFFESRRPQVPLVVDPVFAATSGAKLISDDACDTLREHIFPLATLITPNLAETEILLGSRIEGIREMEQGAAQLGKSFGCNVLVKGGHLRESATDVLYLCREDKLVLFRAGRIGNVNTHGSGCTFAAAIATMLAAGNSLEAAVRNAKSYLNAALAKPVALAESNLIDHFWKQRQPT